MAYPRPATSEVEAQNRISDSLLELITQMQKLRESIDKIEAHLKEMTGIRQRK